MTAGAFLLHILREEVTYMAATRLIPMHINKGKYLVQCLRDRTDYAQNPEKTEKGELVTSYECDPMTCDEEFILSKHQYEHITGRRQKTTSSPIRSASPLSPAK